MTTVEDNVPVDGTKVNFVDVTFAVDIDPDVAVVNIGYNDTADVVSLTIVVPEVTATLAAEVKRPCWSTVITGIFVEPPYVPMVTAVAAN